MRKQSLIDADMQQGHSSLPDNDAALLRNIGLPTAACNTTVASLSAALYLQKSAMRGTTGPCALRHPQGKAGGAWLGARARQRMEVPMTGKFCG